MTCIDCEYLDRYLLKDLPNGEREQFEEHLTNCEICRRAVEQEVWRDDLIKSAMELIPCPPALTARIRQKQNRPRWSAMGSPIAASLVLAMLGWSLVQTPSKEVGPSNGPAKVSMEREPIPDSKPGANSNDDQPTTSKPAVQVEFQNNVISVPIDSGERDITLIQVFPVSNISTETVVNDPPSTFQEP